MDNRENLWAIVLAAGNGRRLAPFLRRRGHQRPKQFCAILGQRTMLEHTWKRVEMIVPRERVLTVADARLWKGERNEMPSLWKLDP